MNHEKHHHEGGWGLKDYYNLGTAALAPFSKVGEGFLHTGMGKNVYPGFISLAAPATPMIWAMGWAEKLRGSLAIAPADDPTPLTYLSFGIVGVSVLHRLDRKIRGGRIESVYSGRPMLLNLFPRLGEVFTKQVVEPALLIGGGLLAIDQGLNRPVASYCIAVGVAMFVASLQRRAYEEWQTQAAFDAMADARRAADRFEEVNGR